jgi:hypothetical protein
MVLRWLRVPAIVFSGALVALALAGPADACTRIGFCGKPRVCHQLTNGSLVCMTDPDPRLTPHPYPIAFPLSERAAPHR